MTKPLTSILKQPSIKMKNKTSDNTTKGRPDITSFTTQREKGTSKASGTNTDPASSLGKRSPVLEKEKTSSKSSKLLHTNRFEPLSEDFQEQLNSPNGKTSTSHSNENRKEKRKPSSLKEAVRQVQQDQIILQDSTYSPSPKKDSTKYRTDTKDDKLSPKKITQETLSPNQQNQPIITELVEDTNGKINTDKSPQKSNQHQEEETDISLEQTECMVLNPYVQRNDPQALARRQAARMRKEEIYQEILEGEKRENEAVQIAYKEARGAPDPSLERKDQRKKSSVSFSIAREDNPIILKDNQIRTFIHRFDLRIQIKATDSEEECEKLLQKQLHLFSSIVLQANESALIPPYLKLDRESAGFKDLSMKYQVSDIKGFSQVKRYFSRLFPRPEGGQYYCNVIIALTNGVVWVTENIKRSLQDNKIGLWKCPTDCEQVSEVGWLLYSTRLQDPERISNMLSKITNEEIGVRWRPVCTSSSFNRKKQDQNSDDRNQVRALHIECDSKKVQFVKHKIAKLYGTTVKQFPDGTKMRLIPPFQSVISEDSKTKYGRVVARQAAFTSKLASATTREFSNNLLLDHKNKDSGLSLRTVLMNIQSSKYPGSSVFHSIDKTWGSDNGVTFTFIPENELEGQMYMTGMIPYLRDAVGEWYLNAFMVEAIETHSDSTWDPETKQISSTTDAWVKNSLALDEEFNYTEYPMEQNPIIFDIPVFTQQFKDVPPIVRDYDSVSTFHSKYSSNTDAHSEDEEMADPDQGTQGQPDNIADTSQTNQVSVDTILISNQEPEISGISDTDSRMSLLQNQISAITSNFTVALEKLASQATAQDENQRIMFEQQRELSLLLRGLIMPNNTQGPVINPSETGTTEEGQLTSPAPQANHLPRLDNAGDSTRAAGSGS
jgi:hypothetical protein